MLRACCCSVSHADAISSISTIQNLKRCIESAEYYDYDDTVSVLEQVVGECDGE